MDRMDWSQLLPENLDIILEKLTDFADYFVFGEVCTLWRSVFLNRRPLNRPPPCIMLTAPDDITTTLPLMVLHRGKLRKFRTRLQLLPQESIVGSTMGWLVLGFIKKPGVHLMNPLSNRRIPIPWVTSSGMLLQSGWVCKSRFQVRDITISSAPTSDGCILVARGVHGSELYLGFLWCRLGDREWNTFPVPLEVGVNVANIMFHDGKLYVLSNEGEILVYSFDPRPNMISKCYVLSNGDSYFCNWQLVDSESEIWILARYSRPQYVKDCVFKQEDGKWVSVDGLGDRVLLKGIHRATSLCIRDLDGLGFEAGCMYYGCPREPPCLMKISLPNEKRRIISIPLALGKRAQRFQRVEWILPQEW